MLKNWRKRTPVDDTVQNGETNRAASSNWAFDHNAAETGVHGAGANDLLNTGDVDDTPIDGATTVPPSSNWAFDHAADVDKHHYFMGMIYKTGEYIAPHPYSFTPGAVAVVAGHFYASEFHVTRAITIDRLAVHVTTGDAGKYVRLGIYNDNGAGYPGTLVSDAGTALVTSTGVQAVTPASDIVLAMGLYWLVVVSDGTPSLYYHAGGYGCVVGIRATDVLSIEGGYDLDSTYAALPDPYTAGASIGARGGFVYPRVKSLD